MNSKTYFSQGNIAFKESNYNLALRFYDRALSTNPELSFVYNFNIGLAEKKLVENEKSLKKNKHLRNISNNPSIINELNHLNKFVDRNKSNFDYSWVRVDNDATEEFLLFVEPSPIKVYKGKKFSIVLAIENPKKMDGNILSSCIKSIFDQTWLNAEVIIVNGSSKGDAGSIEKLMGDSENVRIIYSECSSNKAQLYNLGLSLITGEYCAFASADHWYHPQWIEAAYNALELTSFKKKYILSNLFSKHIYNSNDFSVDGMIFHSLFFKSIIGNFDDVGIDLNFDVASRLSVLNNGNKNAFSKSSLICGITLLERKEDQSNVMEYRKSYEAWLDGKDKFNIYLHKKNCPRLFFKKINNSNENANYVNGKVLNCDICIITDLQFQGGNSSSTLEEYLKFKESGFNVKLVHIPRKGLGNISKKYSLVDVEDVEMFYDIKDVYAKYVIVRSPFVMESGRFHAFASSVNAEYCAFVFNNSLFTAEGVFSYSVENASASLSLINSQRKTLVAISPFIREELKNYFINFQEAISSYDWPPTFTMPARNYLTKTRKNLKITIGRHGRDDVEKWIEDPEKLLQAYPNKDDIEISVLGGAEYARKILNNALPSNWIIHPFGSIDIWEYLNSIDAFVYFPHSGRQEAFGRTIVEAMLMKIPCLLPKRFSSTFGDLAIYCEPCQVYNIVNYIFRNEKMLNEYLDEVSKIAYSLYETNIITSRLKYLEYGELPVLSEKTLSIKSIEFKRNIDKSSLL